MFVKLGLFFLLLVWLVGGGDTLSDEGSVDEFGGYRVLTDADGLTTLVVDGDDIKYDLGNGSFIDSDSVVTSIVNNGGVFEVKSGVYKVEFKSFIGLDDSISLEYGVDEVKMGVKELYLFNGSEKVVFDIEHFVVSIDDNVLSFDNVFFGFRYFYEPLRFKEEIVLKDGKVLFDSGLSGSVSLFVDFFYENDGDDFVLGEVFVEDAFGVRSEVFVSSIPEGLRYELPLSGLERAVFPVLIDPSLDVSGFGNDATISGNVTFDSVNITNNATLYFAYNATAHAVLHVNDWMIVDRGGSIKADAKGSPGGSGAGQWAVGSSGSGAGAGGGGGYKDCYGSCGGYGSSGGSGSGGSNSVNGTSKAVQYAGGAGGGGGDCNSGGSGGGAGGGIVHIIGNSGSSITLSETMISASGSRGGNGGGSGSCDCEYCSYGGGGASGGTILIDGDVVNVSGSTFKVTGGGGGSAHNIACTCGNGGGGGYGQTKVFYLTLINDTVSAVGDTSIHWESNPVLPTTSLVFPLNDSQSSVGMDFNCSVGNSEGALSNVSFYVWNGSGVLWNDVATNFSFLSGSFDSAVFGFDFNVSGVFHWNCLGVTNNSASDWADANWTLVVDVSQPLTYLNFSANGSWFSVEDVDFNCTSVTSQAGAGFLYGDFTGVWGLNQTLSSISSGVMYGFELNLSDGVYSWTCAANKSTDDTVTYSLDGNWSFVVDTTLPVVSVSSPVEGGSWVTDVVTIAIDLEYNVSDVNTNMCWYNVTALDGGNNISTTNVSGCGSTSFVVDVPVSGTYEYHILVCADDKAGNVGCDYSKTNYSVLFYSEYGVPGVVIVGDGGGGAAGVEAALLWRLETDFVGDAYDVLLDPGERISRGLVLFNDDEVEFRVVFVCEDVSGLGDICPFVSFANDSVLLPVVKDAEVVSSFLLSVPESFGRGIYIFNVVGEDVRGGRRSISVRANVGGVTALEQFFIKMKGSRVVDLSFLYDKAEPFRIFNLFFVFFGWLGSLVGLWFLFSWKFLPDFMGKFRLTLSFGGSLIIAVLILVLI